MKVYISRTSSETPVIWMFSHVETSTYVRQYCLPHVDLRFGLFDDAFCSLYYRKTCFLNCTPYLTLKNEMVGAFGTYGRREVCAGYWVEKSEERWPLGRSRCIQKNRQLRNRSSRSRTYVDWIDVAWDTDKWRTLVDRIMNLQIQINAGNLLTGWGTVSFSRRCLFNGVMYLYFMRLNTGAVNE
jgi:hypothetical protein